MHPVVFLLGVHFYSVVVKVKNGDVPGLGLRKLRQTHKRFSPKIVIPVDEMIVVHKNLPFVKEADRTEDQLVTIIR